MADFHVGVCVPCRDIVHAAFSADLATMMFYMGHRHGRDSMSMLHAMGTMIVDQRQGMAKQALEQFKCSHVMFLDTDMRFPANTIERLLVHDKPVVAANYVRRGGHIRPLCWAYDADGRHQVVYTDKEDTGVEEIELVGTGCMLIKREVFETLPLPWFTIPWNPETKEFMGEDIYFCREVRRAGFEIFIDHDLSKEVAHIGTYEYDHDDAYAHRLKYGVE